MVRKKIISFEKDILRQAAKDSKFTESEIKEAYDTFCTALKKEMKSGRWTNIILPKIGSIYLDKTRVNDPRPRTPLGFCKPEGQLLDLINTMKIEMGFVDGNVYRRLDTTRTQHVMDRINRTPEQIEKWQNEDYKNSN
jgi:hypothetical protein